MSIEVTIDGRPCSVAPGTTILEAAGQLDITIPTLCYSNRESKEDTHSSSCSICLVLNKTDNTLVTACDTRINKPVEILTGNEESIRQGRKQSIELLLSEHIGDCIGPCVMSCPAKIDIPEILKRAWIGAVDQVIALLRLSSDGASFPCYDCKAPCLKVCRRRQIDKGVPVQGILIGLFETHREALRDLPEPPRDANLSFKTTTGKMRNDEEREIQLNASLQRRYRPDSSAPEEAGACLQCSCNARNCCELRLWAEAHGAQVRAFRTGLREAVPPAQIYGKLIFQPGKCIHCRRCEVTAENHSIIPVPRVWNRGYRSVMNFLNGEYDLHAAEILSTACPTGALSVNDYDF